MITLNRINARDLNTVSFDETRFFKRFRIVSLVISILATIIAIGFYDIQRLQVMIFSCALIFSWVVITISILYHQDFLKSIFKNEQIIDIDVVDDVGLVIGNVIVDDNLMKDEEIEPEEIFNKIPDFLSNLHERYRMIKIMIIPIGKRDDDDDED